MLDNTDTPNNPVIPQALTDKLIKLARQNTYRDQADFCADDCAGGNIDDAWIGGIADGRSFLAREILIALKVKF